MTEQEVRALTLSDAQLEAVKRIYTASARTKKPSKLDALTTQEQVKAMLDANVAKYNKKKQVGTAQTVNSLLDPSELLKVVNEAVQAGISMDSIVNKVKSMVKTKVNKKLDSEIKKRQDEIAQLTASKIQ